MQIFMPDKDCFWQQNVITSHFILISEEAWRGKYISRKVWTAINNNHVDEKQRAHIITKNPPPPPPPPSPAILNFERKWWCHINLTHSTSCMNNYHETKKNGKRTQDNVLITRGLHVGCCFILPNCCFIFLSGIDKI